MVVELFGDVLALDTTDLHVGAGEFVSLLGPSGCDKTTLLRMIGGLIEPGQGTISVDGRSADAARSATRIGFVPRSPALLPWRTAAPMPNSS